MAQLNLTCVHVGALLLDTTNVDLLRIHRMSQ